MEHQKTLSLVNEPNYSKFMARKWNNVNDHSHANYNIGIKLSIITEVLKSNLCDNNVA